MRRFILGLDEGTTNLRSVLFDVDQFKLVDIESKTFKQYYPYTAWVEHDAEEIYNKILQCSKEVLTRNKVKGYELLGIAITNQRETVVAWNKETGKPICHAICWQCRRTSDMIERLSSKTKEKIKQKTGLIANPYFSASKMKWILENVRDAKALAKAGKLCFGTIDSYLAFRLTGNHVTDTTNASRTMLFNLETLSWDNELLKLFDVPKSSLPKICDSDANFGTAEPLLNAPICSMIGDQMASMFGQGMISSGNTKVTYGTGGFVLTNIGKNSKLRIDNLLTTVASTIDGQTNYAIEGSMYSACSALNFAKDLSLFEEYSQISEMAQSLKSNDGVYFVPAFTGLGAPYWKDDARAAFVGMTLGTTKTHLVRAAMESMVYNTKDILDELKKAKFKIKFISVDGGGSKNEFVLQFLSDMLGQRVVKSKFSEATVLGAIYVALLSLKIVTPSNLKFLTASETQYLRKISERTRQKYHEGWKNAIKKIGG